MKHLISVVATLAILISMLSCMLVTNVRAQDLETAAVSERILYNSAQALTVRSGGGMDTAPTRYGEWGDYGYYVNLITNEATLTSYYGEATDITVPDTVDNYPVTAIGNYAFSWSNLISVVIPGSIKKIDYGAFCYSESLTSVEIGEGVQYLGEYAFEECYALTEVSFPDSLTWIGTDVLFETAFANDPDNWDNGLLYVGRHLVLADETVSGEVTVRDGTLTVAGRAFYPLEGITAVKLPDGLVGIGYEAFAGCADLAEIAFPDSVRVVGSNTILDTAYEDNPDNWSGYMLYCGKHMVQTDYNLSGVAIVDEGTLTLAADVFSNAYNIRVIYLPTDVVYIGDQAIRNNSELGCVAFAGSEEQWNAIGNLPKLTDIPVKFNARVDGDYTYNINDDQTSEVLCYDGYEEGTLVIPDTFEGAPVVSIGNYAFADKYFTELVMPDTVKTIGNYAFYECTEMESIKLSAVLESIGDRAFYDVVTLQSLVLPDTVETIGENAFAACQGLESVVLSSSLKEIGDYAFNYCDLLTSIRVPEGVEVIGDGAFMDCRSLAEITLPSTLTRVGESCIYGTAIQNDETLRENGALYIDGCLLYVGFEANGVLTVKDGTYIVADGACYYCSEITQVVLPETVVLLGRSAFRYCEAMETINLPESILAIGDYAFSHCFALDEITLPSGLQVIEEELFMSCYSLKSIEIPAAVTVIEPYAFAWCNQLEELKLHEGLREIRDYAFRMCAQLKSIDIPEGVQTIGFEAFSDCSSITSVTLPESLVSVDEAAFYWCDALTDVYYSGSASSWEAVEVKVNNEALLEATIHFAKEDEPEKVLGDIDGDGEVSSSDTREFLNVLIFIEDPFTEEDVQWLDVNHDDIVNTADIRALLRQMVSE